MLGSTVAMAGRSMPGSVFSTNREIAISAPVLPALTQAWAAPDFTRLTATRMDESFLKRKACAGGSSMPTTSVAGRICRRGPVLAPAARRAPSSASRGPTRIMTVSGRLRWNASAAGTVTRGPWSPPMQSTAMTISVESAACASLTRNSNAGCGYSSRALATFLPR